MPIEPAHVSSIQSSRSRIPVPSNWPPPQPPSPSTHSNEVRRDPEFQPPPGLDLSKYDRGWRKIVRNFTPSWFTVVMGTGIVSILLHDLPYNDIWLYWISVGIFGLNVLLFCLALAISTLRYTLYPKIWMVMINEPFQAMFLGAFPMGFATIIDMMVSVCVPAWGSWVAVVAWGFWVADSVIAVLCALCLPFLLMIPGKQIELSSVTAVWLLPVISTIVAAAAGSVVANSLPNLQMAVWTLISSYILWGMGMCLAMMILTVYFQRLAMHKIPPKSVIVSVCLPLGPMGQGAYAILNLGVGAKRIFPITKTLDPSSGVLLESIGFVTALALWGFGLVWLFVAVVSLIRSKRFPFTIGWWGSIFPLGVYSNGTVLLSKVIPSKFFKIVGTIISVSVVILWLIVTAGTIKGIVTQKIFYAPCLSDLRVSKSQRRSVARRLDAC
ncbi:Plasma membrane sulfite pump involved in sulfite metabolism [Ophidiomyces ophidiicola]|nr:Plasma membrane sulfite pump involved in sulfite metabolism [Ophidiomyces ophidiicola]KAI1924507.1 Plasma membrane sulfite pump involved in sulfite metabolism [Ophidiomyces ophidiicola]KAI2138323.1 Plasma membrane sulfite pump involved in sulfite metabolism [Ophidiomyces ophidiicola]KAI2372877.1 Plasma membrane sulfite pump involved in sulfite metabolism [Ophidiomyces ophidiicola]KAI2404858.1 Plasma membrane sulfite pump involved in sulfite metabolism [Ophidiomyces ophidiicola]